MKIKLPLHHKMMLFLIPPTILVFFIVVFYIIAQAKEKFTEVTIEIADESAEKYAQQVKANINGDFEAARSLSHTFSSFSIIENAQKDLIVDEILKKVIKQNTGYAAFWLNYELSYVDEKFRDLPGRVNFIYYRNKHNNLKYIIDTLDTDVSGSEATGLYAQIKKTKLETITEPYFYSYKGENEAFLETSICIPIFNKGKFVGLVGSDILLDYFQELINNIEIYGGGYSYLISNKGQIVAFPDADKLGKQFAEEFPEAAKEHNLLSKIENGEYFNYEGVDLLTNKESYITYVPIELGNTNTPWSLAVSIPFDMLKEQAQHILIRIVFISLIGLLLLSLLIYFISINITNPLKRTIFILKKLSKGEIDENDKLIIDSGDEIEDIAGSVNSLIYGLNRTSEFAKTIGHGNLQADYEKLGKNDLLGNSLLEMRQSLIQAEKDEEKRKVEDDKQNWAIQGMAKFGEILRQHNQNIKELSFNIMSNLVDYVDAIQGGLFVKNDDEDDEDETYFELTGAIAYDREKNMDRRFRVGQSLVGRCAYEKLTIYIEDVPSDYANIKSGLGDANPRSILIVPAILNDEVYAIIELVSFSKFEQHKIEFVEKIGESIASTIANARVTERTNKLLEQSKQQSEELAAQEEELRQNIEELQATQEEVIRLKQDEVEDKEQKHDSEQEER